MGVRDRLVSSSFSIEEFEEATRILLRALRTHLQNSLAGKGPVVPMRPVEEIRRRLRARELIERGSSSLEELGSFFERFLDDSMRIHHPRYIAHQGAAPHHLAIVGEIINGITNNDTTVFDLGPAGVALEIEILRWLGEKVGWMHGGHVLTKGGSLGNLTALLAARARACPEAWRNGVPAEMVVLAPKSCHYSLSRAVSILGLGSRSLIPLPVDHRDVLRPDELAGVYRRTRDSGKRVMAVLANASATATGLYDPLEEIGHFCREHDLWLHVDGAHGAAALLSSRLRRLMDGVQFADSLVWNAHKMLLVPVACTAVLFRDPVSAASAFEQDPSYLEPNRDDATPHFYDRSLECSKGVLGLKLFAVLATLGEGRLAEHVETLYDNTSIFHDLIESRSGFGCPHRPQANILCFRYGNDNELQKTIRQRLLDEGEFYITSAKVAGETYLRLTVMNASTDQGVIATLLDRIEEIVATV